MPSELRGLGQFGPSQSLCFHTSKLGWEDLSLHIWRAKFRFCGYAGTCQMWVLTFLWMLGNPREAWHPVSGLSHTNVLRVGTQEAFDGLWTTLPAAWIGFLVKEFLVPSSDLSHFPSVILEPWLTQQFHQVLVEPLLTSLLWRGTYHLSQPLHPLTLRMIKKTFPAAFTYMVGHSVSRNKFFEGHSDDICPCLHSGNLLAPQFYF